MTRYHDYDGPRKPCSPSVHEFATNGKCHRCRWNERDLIAMATAQLKALAPERLRPEA